MTPMKSGPPRRDPKFAGTVSIAQVARRWRRRERDIRRMLGSRELAFVQIGGSLRVPLSEVERYERQHSPPGEEGY